MVKSPGCKLARNALALLDQSLAVYEEGSRLCRPPATVVRTRFIIHPEVFTHPSLMQHHRSQSMLQKLHIRAHHTYSTFCSGVNGGSQAPLLLTRPDDIHDLSAFGGTKGSVINKSPTSSPRGSDMPSPDSCLSTVSVDIPANPARAQRSSHSPSSLARQSPLAYSSSGSSPPHQPDSQVMTQLSYGSMPGPVQQRSQFRLPYPTEQDVTPTRSAPDFRTSTFVPQEQHSLLPSLDGGYSVCPDTAQFPPTAQESTHQQDPLAPILDIDLEALGLLPGPQQPMQYNQYPQLQQFQDIFMDDDDASARPPQIPQDDVWWKFVDDLGIQRI